MAGLGLFGFLRRFRILLNRRRFKRVRVPFLLRYTVEEIGVQGITNLHDLSVGGVLFTAEEGVPKGARVRLEIALPKREQPIITFARVVRVSRVPHWGLYRVATEFENLKVSDRKEIRRLVERFALGKPE